jgi:hypothetical protein
MSAFPCSKCGADLPEPDRYGNSWCDCCGAGNTSRERKSAGELLSAVELVATATRIPLTDDAVLELLRSRVSGHLYLQPHVPSTRERGARRMHYAHLPEMERILALYDASGLGDGEEGFVVTSRRLCWKNHGGTARMIEWFDVDADNVYGEGGLLFVGGDVIAVGGEILESCVDLFYVLANSARPPSAAPSSSGVVPAMETVPPRVHVQTTAPPPAGISYSAYVEHASSQPPPSWCCWKCKTPLYRSTPQCGQCGAVPAPFGWLRTG